MTAKRFRITISRAILVMASFLFISCEKSTGEIGLDLVNGSQAVLGTKKKLPIVTYNVTYDSIPSSGPNQEIVGNYKDPFLGQVDTRFNTHLLLSEVNLDFGDNPICDSVVMFIAYSGYYGDTSMPVTIVVNELGEFVDSDSLYFSNQTFALGDELGRTTTVAKPRTVVAYQGDTISPAMRFTLDKNYFQQKIIDASKTNPEHFVDNGAFENYMYGIDISAEGNGGGLLYFNVGSLSTFVKMYYRPTPADTVSSVYEMVLGSLTSKKYISTNSFFLDPSQGGPNLGNQDTVNGEATIYSQALGGVNARIMFPNLKELKDSNWVINRAEIIFHVREGSVGKYALPNIIYILEERNGKRYFIDDYFNSGLPVGGSLIVGQLRDNSYNFNISSLVNRYINTEDTIRSLILRPDLSSSNGWRAVLNGNQDPVKPVEFNIFYTKTED